MLNGAITLWTQEILTIQSFGVLAEIVFSRTEDFVSAWDTKIANGRFKLLQDFNNEAVLDKETGLVWERQPSNLTFKWPNARLFCAQKGVGGRGGWRLPAFYELASLVDPAVQVGPQLPAGHPFLQVQASDYWTDTQFADEPGFVRGSNLNDETYFDIRFIPPNSSTEQIALHWQRGVSASHSLPIGTAVGTWRVTGVRPHQDATDHSGDTVCI
jgi:Protein of unknown function (DUF1566)